MILGYDFHLQGKRHRNANKPGQDFSLIYEISPAWKIAAVADGVSASSQSELASKIACKTACEYIEKAFPFDSFSNSIVEEDVESVIRSALHAAANNIEHYAEENETELDSLDTTLVIALYNGQTAYLGLIGDSGIGILKNDGQLLFSAPMNDEVGHVYPLRFRKAYKTASIDNVAAVFCMSDGIYKDHLMKYGEFDQHIADGYIPYRLFSECLSEDKELLINNFKQSIIEACETNEGLTDDLSIALIINTEKEVKPVERKEPDIIHKIKAELSIYEVSIQEKMFKDRLSKLFPFINEQNTIRLYNDEIELDEAIAESLSNLQTQSVEKNALMNNSELYKLSNNNEDEPKGNNPNKSDIQSVIADAKEKVQELFSKKDNS